MKRTLMLFPLVFLTVAVYAQQESKPVQEASTETTTISLNPIRPFKMAEPLYVLHVDKLTFESIDQVTGEPVLFSSIDPKLIENIQVLKGESATKQYGDRGQNGVVIINLKDAYSKYLSEEFLKKFKEVK